MEDKKLKRRQEIKLTISDLAFGGRGISKKNDLVFFVKDAIPNQDVIAKISKIKKNYVEAYSIETIKKSKDQVDPPCEHFEWCGGCTTQQLDYQKQLYFKQKQISDILNKIAGEKDIDINPIIGCEQTFFYRNKMEYTFSGVPWYIGDESYDDVVIGLHVPKRFDKILNINKCHINHDVFNDILQISKEVSIKEKMVPYDVRKHTGFLRFLVIRIGVHTNEVMVNLVTAGYKPEIIKPLVDELVDKIPNIKSIVNTINTKKVILYLAHLNYFMAMSVLMKKLESTLLKFLQIHFSKQTHIKLKNYMIISLKQQNLKRVISFMIYIVVLVRLEFI